MAENRTADFRQLCQQFTQQQQQQQRLAVVPQQKHARHSAVVHESVQFNAAASDISKEVYQASKRLQQLTQLVRQNNMFNDPTDAINELAALVKSDITAINAQLDNLQEYVNSKRATSSSSRQAATHSDAIVSLMKTNLMATTKGFKDVLEVRQANMALQQHRRARYGKTASSALGKPLTFAAPQPPVSTLSVANSTRLDTLPRPNGVQSNADADSESMPLIAPLAQQHVEQQHYTEARAEAVSQIESHIVDIGQMFGRLATILHEQEDLVRRIDDHVDDTLANVNAGEHELLKYFASLSSNRLLALKVAAILLVFLVFFMVVLA